MAVSENWIEDEVPSSYDVIFWAIQMHGDLSGMFPEGIAQ